jgi:hypothetical protein
MNISVMNPMVEAAMMRHAQCSTVSSVFFFPQKLTVRCLVRTIRWYHDEDKTTNVACHGVHEQYEDAKVLHSSRQLTLSSTTYDV